MSDVISILPLVVGMSTVPQTGTGHEHHRNVQKDRTNEVGKKEEGIYRLAGLSSLVIPCCYHLQQVWSRNE
jgi:hypothetical protein